MPRLPRVAIAEYPHHVTQRGNRKADVFIDESDRRVYMKLLAKETVAYGVRIWAYCLMNNHVHLIAVPESNESLSNAFQRIHGDYVNYFNAKYSKSGHLWQGRFKSTVMDTRHLWNGVRYVERNPVRAGLVLRAQDFLWSSAAAHCGIRQERVLSNDLPLLEAVSDWSAWLSVEEQEDELRLIRERTRSGRPYADDESTRSMEIQLGRKLLPQKPGPKKSLQEEPENGRQLSLPDEFGD